MKKTHILNLHLFIFFKKKKKKEEEAKTKPNCTTCLFACSDTDVHTVASLLKLYLRELPVPVVPWTQYHDFLSCTDPLDSEVCLEAMKW